MTKETLGFNAEVDRILHLMIHSLYTNKDIFLRELISNSSDACDKIRYEAAKKPDILGEEPLKITISADEKKKLLSIKDNGIGMNKEDLISNLGTIASSGTREFLSNLSGDSKKDMQLIGQFGVGFYSVFMVAEDVEVKSLKAGESTAWKWSSKGDGKFSIEEEPGKKDRGTEIIIKIREGEEQYLDRFRINHIVSTYSDHISIPIEFISKDEEEPKVLNSSSALWSKPKNEITQEQYNEFYKKTAMAGDTPWMIIHNVNEGKVNYTNLLFIPSAPTFDMHHPDRKRRVKLYIRRVFINDEGIDLIPHYLRFLRGVIDSEDLPLNISRENLQHNVTLGQIKTSVTKKVLNSLEKKLKDDKKDYLTFWKNFGSVIKEGLCEGFNVPDNLLDICLFRSAKSSEYISLAEYKQNMPKNQKEIYYVSGDSYEKLTQHPQMDGFLEKGFDVLIFTDTVDDFWVNVVNQYKDTPIKSITRTDIDLEDDKEPKQEDKEQAKNQKQTTNDVTEYFKKILASYVADVVISKKLSSAPVCLSVKEGGMDIRMERYLIEQKQLKAASAKILEVNLNHPVIKYIAKIISKKTENKSTENIVRSLYDEACVVEGEPVPNPKEFSARLNDLLEKAMAD